MHVLHVCIGYHWWLWWPCSGVRSELKVRWARHIRKLPTRKKKGGWLWICLTLQKKMGGGDSNAFNDSLFHWTFIKYTTTKFFSTRVCTGELVMIDWHTKYWFNFWHSWIKSWRWWGVPEILFAHCEPNKQ